MPKLANKVALITGATSGMGLATAQLFVEEGAYVFITGRRQAELDEAVRTIGRNVTGVRCDSGNLADLDQLFATIKASQGHLDIVFACAGAAGFAPLEAITEEQFDEQFRVNAKGTLFTVQKALPLLRDHGAIILNGSISAQQGAAGTSVYSASKATLLSYAKVWTSDLKTRSIRVNVLNPGPIDTPLLAHLPAAQQAALIAKVPLGRAGRPREIATAVLFLACDDAGFITGSALDVDGGAA